MSHPYTEPILTQRKNTVTLNKFSKKINQHVENRINSQLINLVETVLKETGYSGWVSLNKVTFQKTNQISVRLVDKGITIKPFSYVDSQGFLHPSDLFLVNDDHTVSIGELKNEL